MIICYFLQLGYLYEGKALRGVKIQGGNPYQIILQNKYHNYRAEYAQGSLHTFAPFTSLTLIDDVASKYWE